MLPRRRCLAFVTVTLLVTASATIAAGAAAATVTTAWQNGAFSVNTGGVVSRSDIVLGQPNSADTQSLPLGNGSLGVAAWAANGFTAQLNRSDHAVPAVPWADTDPGPVGDDLGPELHRHA